MSQYMILLTRCNGCGLTNVQDGIEIVDSQEYTGYWEATKTADICGVCASLGRYICPGCHDVVRGDHQCEIAAAQAAARSE